MAIKTPNAQLLLYHIINDRTHIQKSIVMNFEFSITFSLKHFFRFFQPKIFI